MGKASTKLRLDDKERLIAIVAHVEALFWPFRYYADRSSNAALAAVCERRREYHRHGISLRIGGGADERMRGYRSLQRMQSQGLIRIHRGRGEQRQTVELSRLDACLSLAGSSVTTGPDTWQILERLVELDDDPDVHRQGGGISDEDVMPFDVSDSRAAWQFQVDALPLLVRGWVTTWSDGAGCCAWSLTDCGREALAAGPPTDDDRLPFASELEDFYWQTLDRELDERERWKPSRVTEIAIPLSCGLWLTRAEQAEYDRERQEAATDA
jgi:hypothetical protein